MFEERQAGYKMNEQRELELESGQSQKGSNCRNTDFEARFTKETLRS